MLAKESLPPSHSLNADRAYRYMLQARKSGQEQRA